MEESTVMYSYDDFIQRKMSTIIFLKFQDILFLLQVIFKKESSQILVMDHYLF